MIKKHNLSSRKSVFVVNKSDAVKTLENTNSKVRLDNYAPDNKKSGCC